MTTNRSAQPIGASCNRRLGRYNVSKFSAFKTLWKRFLGRSGTLLLERVEKDLELILWSSDLTGSEHMDSLPPDTFTVQVLVH